MKRHFCVCMCSVRRLLIASFTIQPHTSSASVPNPWNIPRQSRRSHFVTDKYFPGTARHRFLRLSPQLHTSTFREQYRSSTRLGLLGRCRERAATRSHPANHCTACSKYWTVYASTLFPEKLRACLSRASRANHRLGSITLFTALLLDIPPVRSATSVDSICFAAKSIAVVQQVSVVLWYVIEGF